MTTILDSDSRKSSRQSGDYEDFVYCDLDLYNDLKPKTVSLIEAIKGLITDKNAADSC